MFNYKLYTQVGVGVFFDGICTQNINCTIKRVGNSKHKSKYFVIKSLFASVEICSNYKIYVLFTTI